MMTETAPFKGTAHLRELSEEGHVREHIHTAGQIRAAADEIERLRAANAVLRENARMWARAAGAIFEDVTDAE